MYFLVPPVFHHSINTRYNSGILFSGGLWIYPYIILYFKQLGLTTTECSVIYGALPMFNGFFKLFIGAVADKLQRHKEMILLFGLGGAVLMNCLQLVPPVDVIQAPEPDWNGTLYYMCTAGGRGDTQTVVCVVKNASRLHPMVDKSNVDAIQWYKIKNGEFNKSLNDCVDQPDVSYQVQDGCWDDMDDEVMDLMRTSRETSENKIFICALDCNKYPDELLNPSELEKVMFGKTFWMTFWFYFVGFNIYASIWVLLYGMNYAILGEKRNNFGRQRLWGTFGALTTAIISAFALNKYGSSTPEITFTPCFIGFGVLAVITGIVAMFFKLPYMASNPAMAKDMCKLLREPQISLLFVVLFIMGFLFAAADTFLFVYLRSLGASSWTLGVCLFVRYLGEIPSLYYSGHIIKKIGHVGCVYIVLVAYFVRYLGASLIPNPWWEIPFSLLSSVVFSIGFTAVSVYSSLITPPSMHATLQAMVQTIHFGLGKLLFHFKPSGRICHKWTTAHVKPGSTLHNSVFELISLHKNVM